MIYRIILIFTIAVLISCNGTDESGPVKMLWFDGTANFGRLSSRDSIDRILDRCVEAGITDIAVDLKPNSGLVLYNSRHAQKLNEWQGSSRPADFDLLKIMSEAARERGLKIHAALNIFSEGSRPAQQGLVFTKHPEWQTMLNTPEGIKPILDVPGKASLFVNPLREDVVEYELSLVKEIMSGYKLDGIILDRARFESIEADFSDLAKLRFEAFTGSEVRNWPDDVFFWEENAAGEYGMARGPLFKDWLYWRAQYIKQFFATARRTVKEVNPDIRFGTYAGSWYPIYYEVGVNWASEDYQPLYDWARKDYNRTGYAELLDFFCSGCYFSEVTKADLQAIKNEISEERWQQAMGEGGEYWYSVEGACENSMRLIKDAAPVYGSIYVLQYKNNPQKFAEAIKMCLEKTNGVMIFDLVYIENYDWWPVMEQALKYRSEEKN